MIRISQRSLDLPQGFEWSRGQTGERVLSIYLDPLAWKQIRQLALDSETSTQALGEEVINLLFEKHRLNRSA